MHTTRTIIIVVAVLALFALRWLPRLRKLRSKGQEGAVAPALKPSRPPRIQNRRWRVFSSLTVASMKMYFRNRSALFFTVFFPIVLVSVFGLLSNGNGNGSIKLDLTNYSHSQLATAYVKAVEGVSAFKVTETSEATARDQLGNGKIDLEMVIPKDFGAVKNGRPVASNIHTYYNQARPGNGQTAGLILGQIAAGFNQKLTHAPTVFGLTSTGVKTNNLGYIDFILPGILAMTIMQLGIFSVAFGFISFKTSGALRRIQATPINAANFLVAQSITRYLVGMLQLVVLTGLGLVLFHLHLLGSIFYLWIVVTLGIGVFLAMGFAVAGAAKDENQAAPLAQILQLPQLFLSGIFFPRDDFPHWLQVVTNYFPLTYLSDAMRSIFNEGTSLWALRADIAGLVAWLVIAYLIADRVFSWE